MLVKTVKARVTGGQWYAHIGDMGLYGETRGNKGSEDFIIYGCYNKEDEPRFYQFIFDMDKNKLDGAAIGFKTVGDAAEYWQYDTDCERIVIPHGDFEVIEVLN